MTQTKFETPTVLGAPSGANVVAVLAHPDDEFLIGGALGQFHAHDITTHAVIATDGEASDRASLHELQRRLEAGKALAKYGVRREHQHFLGLPDGVLSSPTHLDTIAAVIGSLLEEYAVRTVVTLGHYGYDNHPDHKAAHLAAERSAAAHAVDNPDISLYGLTHYDTGVQLATDPVTKLQRLAYHKSQFDIDTSDPSYVPIPGTIEQPGIQLSPATRERLASYYFNTTVLERYSLYPLNREEA